MRYLILLLLSFTAFADNATVTYDAPTERVDGTPLAPSEIGGFNVYDSQGNVVKQLAGDVRDFQVTSTSALQSLYVTTVDTVGRESAYSAEVIIPAGVPDPKPIMNIQVTVTP